MSKGEIGIIDSDADALEGTPGQTKDYIRNNRLDLSNVLRI